MQYLLKWTYDAIKGLFGKYEYQWHKKLHYYGFKQLQSY